MVDIHNEKNKSEIIGKISRKNISTEYNLKSWVDG